MSNLTLLLDYLWHELMVASFSSLLRPFEADFDLILAVWQLLHNVVIFFPLLMVTQHRNDQQQLSCSTQYLNVRRETQIDGLLLIQQSGCGRTIVRQKTRLA